MVIIMTQGLVSGYLGKRFNAHRFKRFGFGRWGLLAVCSPLSFLLDDFAYLDESEISGSFLLIPQYAADDAETLELADLDWLILGIV